MADHAYTDEFGWPLKTVTAGRWLRNKRKPMYENGKPVAKPDDGKRLASGLVTGAKKKVDSPTSPR